MVQGDSSTSEAALDLPDALGSYRGLVETKLRSLVGDLDGQLRLPNQLESLHQALEELNVAWEGLHGRSHRLLQERQHYADLFESAPDALVVTDAAGAIQEMNAAARLLLRYRALQLLRKPLQLFITAESRPAFRTNLNALLLSHTPKSWDGELSWGNEPVKVQFTVGRVIGSEKSSRCPLCWVIRRRA